MRPYERAKEAEHFKPIEVWTATIGNSILGPVVLGVRRRGRKSIPAAKAPDYVREWLGLVPDRNARPVVLGELEKQDRYTFQQIRALEAKGDQAGEGDTIHVSGRKSGWVRVTFKVRNPTREAPRPRLTVEEHGPLIRNMRELCEFFGADTPASLNRRVYKDTDCGASISIRLSPRDRTVPTDGRLASDWIHNGDKRWELVTFDTKIDAFTIQTIVEGSEATVDSDLFLVPCTQHEVDGWIESMEQEASDLWAEANARDDEDDSDPPPNDNAPELEDVTPVADDAPKGKVWADCAREHLPYDQVVLEFLDVSEGVHGEDRVTYKCRRCGELHVEATVIR